MPGILLLLLLALSVRALAAQSDSAPSLTVEPRWSAERFVANRTALDLTLSRPLVAPNERLALIVGSLDVSAVLEVRGRLARYRPTSARLPSGESEIVAYLVRGPSDWTEVGRFPLKVRGRMGLDQGRVAPTVDVSGSALLRERLPDGDTAPPDRAERDLTLRLGFESMVARNGWQVTTQANALGATVEAQRLRWNELSAEAPAVDLSDYRVNLERGRSRLTIGNNSVGSNRYLLSGFSSRGLAAALGIGSIATFDAALMNGTSVVGWSNPFGLQEPEHRIGTSTLALELLPSRPGAFHVDISGMSGSVLPLTSFNQGAATDAEESHGVGVQVQTSDPGQRIRLTAGVARSRFVNPVDPLLSGDTTVVAVRPSTRTARFGEVGVQLLRSLTITPSVKADLSATLRHERVDPLYRSVGAGVQSDIENNGLDVTGSLGALSLQAALARSRDNLDDLASVLTTRNRSTTLGAALPLSALLRADAGVWYWPTLTVNSQRNHQYGEGVPTNADFTATHVPDQLSTNWSASSAWTGSKWSLTYRWNQSFQDNRQTGREQADFRATVQGVSLGLTSVSGFTTSLDVGRERQTSIETGASQFIARVGTSLQWQPFGATAFSGSTSYSRAVDPFASQRTRNLELQAELSQGFNLYRRQDSQTQGRVFLRFARTRAAVVPFEPVSPLLLPRIGWSLNAGGSLRVY